MMGSYSIPKRHLAMVYDRPGTISLKQQEVDTPEPGPGEILVRITHSGVCRSDHGVMTHAWTWLPRKIQPGQIGGHEGVGHIVHLGPALETNHLRLGDRVGIKWVSRACLTCAPCLAGADGCCTNIKISGYYTPGTFQQYCLAPAYYVTPIPDGVPSALAAPLLCGGLSAYSALKKARTNPGDWLVVSGAGGGVGHMAVQIAARVMGLRVVGVDRGVKEGLCRGCGVEVFVAVEECAAGGRDELVRRVRLATDGVGAMAVLVCNGSSEAYGAALGMLRFNGTVVVVGVQEGEETPIESATPNEFLFEQKCMVGSSVGNRKDAVELMAHAARGVIKPSFQTLKLEDLPSIFQDMERGTLLGKVVVEVP